MPSREAPSDGAQMIIGQKEAEIQELRQLLLEADAGRRQERGAGVEQHRINAQLRQQLQQQQAQLDARARDQPPPQQQQALPRGRIPAGGPVVQPANALAHPVGGAQLDPPANTAPVLNMVAPQGDIDRIGAAIREARAKEDDKRVVLPKLVLGTKASSYNICECPLVPPHLAISPR